MTTPLLLAQFSNLAYNDNQQFPGYQSILIDRKGSQAYFLFNIDTIIIVCRGTQVTEWQDIVADIRFKLVPSSSGIGKVHKGFKASVDNVWDDIVKLFKKYPNRRVYLTGHSLGAAMATLMAARCHRTEGMPNPVLYTFGSPRVGDLTYIRLLNSLNIEHYRFVNNTDIVTRNPIFPYKHHGKLMYFDHYGDVRTFNSWQRIKDHVKGFWFGIKKGKLNLLDNHFMNNYIENIKRNSL